MKMPEVEKNSRRKRALLLAECLVLFFLVPPSLYFWRERLAFKIVPLVLGPAFVAYLLLRRDVSFNRRTMWFTPKPFTHLKNILCIFFPGALAIPWSAVKATLAPRSANFPLSMSNRRWNS